MKKGYLLTAVVVFLAAVAVLVGVVTAYVSNTSNTRVIKEKLLMASGNSMNGLQMATSYLAHFASSVGGFYLDFTSPAATSFSSVPWLRNTTSNNYFNSIYSSVDGNAWKKALSSLATDEKVLWLNKIPAVQSFFQSLEASGVINSIPEVVVIQTYAGDTSVNDGYRYFIVSQGIVGGQTAYSSGFVIANFLNRYVYFTDEEPPYKYPFYNVTFLTGDTVDGPVRTNGDMITMGNPDFKGYAQYGGLDPISGYPLFESGSATLSAADIASMNMSKIASDYSVQIDSQVTSPSNLKAIGNSATSSGLDLSVVYQNLLNMWNGYGFSSGNYTWQSGGYYTLNRLDQMFVNDFVNWSWGRHEFSSLPTAIQNDYNNVLASIDGIPSLKVTFSRGQGSNSAPTITVDYGIDTSNAVNALKHLQTDIQMYLNENIRFSDLLSVLENVPEPNWNQGNLLTINPIPSDSVPGPSQMVINGQTAADLLGLQNSQTFDFNFNGVVKSNSDLVIGDPNETSIVSGKYTLYTTKSAVVNGNIVYDYINQEFGKTPPKKNWTTTPVSTSDVTRMRDATGTDFLNIVSNYDVSLTNTSQYAKLMASIYAFKGTFWDPDFENQTWKGQPGQLFEFGSMAQYEGGQLFGTYSGKSLSTGYHAYYAFDWRILGGLPANMYGTPSSKYKALLLAVRTVF